MSSNTFILGFLQCTENAFLLAICLEIKVIFFIIISKLVLMSLPPSIIFSTPSLFLIYRREPPAQIRRAHAFFY